MKQHRWPRQVLACLLIALLLVGCASPSAADRGELRSHHQESPLSAAALVPTVGETAPPNPQPAERVIALTSLTADLLYRLDSRKLVGIASSRLLANDPRLKDIPAVSTGQTPPNLEKIVALKPDLVVGARGFHDQALKRLDELGISTLTTDVKSWQALSDLIQTLAWSIGASPRSLLFRFQKCTTEGPNQQYKTLVLASWQPILSPNKDSWAGDVLRQLNARNVAADLQGKSPFSGYVTLSAEKILKADPDRIILVNLEDGSLEKFKAQPFWQQLQATKKGQVYDVDYYGLVNPGSLGKIEQACRELRRALS